MPTSKEEAISEYSPVVFPATCIFVPVAVEGVGVVLYTNPRSVYAGSPISVISPNKVALPSARIILLTGFVMTFAKALPVATNDTSLELYTVFPACIAYART